MSKLVTIGTQNRLDMETEDLEACKRELQTLYAAVMSLPQGSMVTREVNGLLSRLQRATEEEERHRAELMVPAGASLSSGSAAASWRLKVQLAPQGQQLILAGVSADATMEQLKALIEDSVDNQVVVHRVTVLGTGGTRVFGDFDSRRMAACGITDRATVMADTAPRAASSRSASAAAPDAEAASSSQTTLPGGFGEALPEDCSGCHFVALLMHSFMHEAGFTGLMEVLNTVAGFAPALRELSKGQFVPPNWRGGGSGDTTGGGTATFLYKHHAKPGKNFSLVVLGMGEMAIATVSMKRGDSFNVEVDVARFVDVALLGDASRRPAVQADPSTACRDLSTLREMLLTPVEHLVPTAPSGSTCSTEGAPPRQQQPPQFIPAHPGVPGGAPYGGNAPLVPGVGSGNAFPHFDPNPFQPRLDRPGGPLVGPGHPLFGGIPPPGPDMGPFAPGFEGPGMPHPRFDPFGPLPGRGGRAPGRGGRGRGRGRGGRGTQSGEPDPDVFFPPDQFMGGDGFI